MLSKISKRFFLKEGQFGAQDGLVIVSNVSNYGKKTSNNRWELTFSVN